jgi:hypothetical protein
MLAPSASTKGMAVTIMLLAWMMTSPDASAKSICRTWDGPEISEYKEKLYPIAVRLARSRIYAPHIDLVTVIAITIDKNGRLIASETARRSRSPWFDQEVLLAFPVGLRLPPLPACGPESIKAFIPIRVR